MWLGRKRIGYQEGASIQKGMSSERRPNKRLEDEVNEDTNLLTNTIVEENGEQPEWNERGQGSIYGVAQLNGWTVSDLIFL